MSQPGGGQATPHARRHGQRPQEEKRKIRRWVGNAPPRNGADRGESPHRARQRLAAGPDRIPFNAPRGRSVTAASGRFLLSRPACGTPPGPTGSHQAVLLTLHFGLDSVDLRPPRRRHVLRQLAQRSEPSIVSRPPISPHRRFLTVPVPGPPVFFSAPPGRAVAAVPRPRRALAAPAQQGRPAPRRAALPPRAHAERPPTSARALPACSAFSSTRPTDGAHSS